MTPLENFTHGTSCLCKYLSFILARDVVYLINKARWANIL